MKMKWIIALVLSGVLMGCSSETKEEKDSHPVETTEGLSLNNGEKWPVNEETHQGMTNIKVLLENADPLTLDDYHFMAGTMDEHTGFIIQNCSMTGEAHEQLHHVLHPILDLIAELANAKDDNEAAEIVSKIDSNIQDYFNHFIHP